MLKYVFIDMLYSYCKEIIIFIETLILTYCIVYHNDQNSKNSLKKFDIHFQLKKRLEIYCINY